MSDRISVDFLRGIVMRAPNANSTKDFYVENWGLRILSETADEVLFRGTGPEQFSYFVSPSGVVIEFTCEVEQIDEATHKPQVWPRNVPEKMDVWMTSGPPTPAMRTVMAGRPDPGFPAS